MSHRKSFSKYYRSRIIKDENIQNNNYNIDTDGELNNNSLSNFEIEYNKFIEQLNNNIENDKGEPNET